VSFAYQVEGVKGLLELVSCQELVFVDGRHEVLGVVDLARVVGVCVLDDVLDHLFDFFWIEMVVHLFVAWSLAPTLDEFFSAQLAVLIRVEPLEEALEFLDVVVVGDVGDDEGEDRLDQLALELK
jgi:hypothetical protein